MNEQNETFHWQELRAKEHIQFDSKNKLKSDTTMNFMHTEMYDIHFTGQQGDTGESRFNCDFQKCIRKALGKKR